MGDVPGLSNHPGNQHNLRGPHVPEAGAGNTLRGLGRRGIGKHYFDEPARNPEHRARKRGPPGRYVRRDRSIYGAGSTVSLRSLRLAGRVRS